MRTAKNKADDWLKILRQLAYYRQRGIENFSSGNVARDTSTDRFVTLRVCRVLERIGYVVKRPTGYKHRHWSFTNSCPKGLSDFLAAYENFKVVHRAYSKVEFPTGKEKTSVGTLYRELGRKNKESSSS